MEGGGREGMLIVWLRWWACGRAEDGAGADERKNPVRELNTA